MHYDHLTAPDHGQEEVSEHGIPRTLAAAFFIWHEGRRRRLLRSAG